MDSKPLIAGNWKMHKTHLEAIQIVQKLHYRLDSRDFDRVEVALAPPFTALRSVQTIIDADHMLFRLAAQNCDWREEGAVTGEVSAPMLAKLSVDFVIVGHSERRQLFEETDDIVNRKTKAVLGAGMSPIVAVGETLSQREAEETEQVLRGQIRGSLRGLGEGASASLVVAYEPIWAIGTGHTATPEQAAEAIEYIRGLLAGLFGEEAEGIRILYGGSVNPGNIAALMAKKSIDGALVGGASLDPDEFASIVRYWA
ncbi:MAG: triose-phosphate isomerase [Acidimicrobiia bacterium]